MLSAMRPRTLKDWQQKDDNILKYAMIPFDIPRYNLSGVLPPYVADPTNPALMSPYRASLAKMVERFGTSPRRLQILWGLTQYRQELVNIGLSGFQWLDGSFVEDIEKTERRDPGDIDLVTFFKRPSVPRGDDLAMRDLVRANVRLFKPSETKIHFSCDAYFVDLDTDVTSVVGRARYWYGLFSHKRTTMLWKGLLEIALGDASEETEAAKLIRARL